MTTVFIYGLIDPRTNEIRYIGYTPDPNKRLKGHLYNCRWEKTHKANWIKSLLKLGLKPEMIILQEVPESEWQIAEQAWIRFGWEEGWRLTNGTMGGDGILGHIFSEESLQKMSDAKKGNKSRAGMSNSDEHKRKIGEAHKGKVVSEETRRKISEACRKRWRKG